MEESKKLFSQRAISIATFFGGPAAAGYLVKKNYEVFDQPEKGKNAFIIGIISTLLLFIGIFLIPENILEYIPKALIPAFYTTIIYVIVEKIQGKWLDQHEESGGQFYSAWKATGIGAIFMVILLALIAGIAFIAGDFSKIGFDAKTYDKEVAKFVENEKRSMEVFNVINSAEPQYLIKEFQNGIILWKENKEIVNKLNTMKNLPKELLEQNNKLLNYCDLRIQQNEFIVKALSEDTDRYVPDLDRIGMEMTKVLEELQELKK